MKQRVQQCFKIQDLNIKVQGKTSQAKTKMKQVRNFDWFDGNFAVILMVTNVTKQNWGEKFLCCKAIINALVCCGELKLVLKDDIDTKLFEKMRRKFYVKLIFLFVKFKDMQEKLWLVEYS